jgi:hypothetical protein
MLAVIGDQEFLMPRYVKTRKKCKFLTRLSLGDSWLLPGFQPPSMRRLRDAIARRVRFHYFMDCKSYGNQSFHWRYYDA